MRIQPTRQWERILALPKADPDGQAAEVLVRRFPTVAFRLNVAPDVDHEGHALPALVMDMPQAPSMRSLAIAMAEDAAHGRMLANSLGAAPTGGR